MSRPTHLQANIGGYPGPYYEVALVGDELEYDVSWADPTTNEAPIPPPSDPIQPTTGEWAAFEAVLTRIGAWDWEPEYQPDAPICDGTSWNVEIRWGDRAIRSCGSNASPDPFDDFLEALRALIGGREFH